MDPIFNCTVAVITLRLGTFYSVAVCLALSCIKLSQNIRTDYKRTSWYYHYRIFIKINCKVKDRAIN